MLFEVRTVVEAPDHYTQDGVLTLISAAIKEPLREHTTEVRPYGISDPPDLRVEEGEQS